MAFDVLPTEELADRFSGTGDAAESSNDRRSAMAFDLSLSLGELVGGSTKIRDGVETHITVGSGSGFR